MTKCWQIVLVTYVFFSSSSPYPVHGGGGGGGGGGRGGGGGGMRFFENIFSLDFLTLWCSYSRYSIITGSGTQQVNYMENFV